MKYNMKVLIIAMLVVTITILAGCADTIKEELDIADEDEKQAFEVDKDIRFKAATVGIFITDVYVEDDEFTLHFTWNFNSSYDETHFTVLAVQSVKQNGEYLELTDGEDTMLRKTKRGVNSIVSLNYELEDDSPVTVKFSTWGDNPEEESFTVDIEE